jgi:hypothetical protein
MTHQSTAAPRIPLGNDPAASQRRRMLIIHGVGDFDEATITAEVRALATKYGIAASDVSAFNWDREIGAPFKGFDLDLAILAELGGGLLNLANLGFLQTSRAYCGIPQWYIRLQNWLFALAQLGLSFLVLLFPCAILNKSYKLGLMSAVATLVALAAVGALLSFSTKGVIVHFRRLVVTILWPVFHFLAVPVGFQVIELVGAIASVRIFLTLDESIHSGAILGSLVSSVVMIVVTLIPIWLISRVTNPVLKVLSDIARYIGLVKHRRTLQCMLAKRFEQVTADCDHLIILAHSLGSVIAVDTMLENKKAFANLRQLDFITMGSPLRRMFHRFFPEIYSSVEAIHEELRKHIPRFGWVNIYRPLDCIGAHLSANVESTLTEFDTSEFHTHEFFKNHTNYWNDEIVAELIAKGIEKTNRLAPGTSAIEESTVANWPTALCASSYPGAVVSKLWTHRYHVFMGVFLLWILWQLFVLVGIDYKALRKDFSPEFIRFEAEHDGWISTILFRGFELGMSLVGSVMIGLFAYKKVWREWIGAYGASLFGCVEEAKRNPMMRSAPQLGHVQSSGE